jgi:hypothetical protein
MFERQPVTPISGGIGGLPRRVGERHLSKLRRPLYSVGLTRKTSRHEPLRGPHIALCSLLTAGFRLLGAAL